ncbi:MAG: DNA replication and repair protein RecF [Synergistaceae bacterium]|jgi:DNA replication and repair protein RecF|nr:DNA replication and repair protein RecF [Synergistaceae bacterium]
MYFSDTYFHNFRNLRQGRVSWSSGFNLISGPNGAGKTNFIEGLNLISGWGPIESATKISSVPAWGKGSEPKASLWARVQGEESMDLFASISVKCSLKCGEKAIGASAMRAKIPVLTFLSDGMSLIRGSASARRALLDRIGAIISPSYAMRLHDYRKALRQKTVLLRRGRETMAADRVLVQLGSWLWAAREEILKLLSSALESYAELTPCPMELLFTRGGGGTAEGPSEDFKGSLAVKKNRERDLRTPLVGPQRDDVRILCGGINAVLFLSRGQSRRAASALILAASAVVERRIGRKPILIFDELTSELDEEGRNSLVEALLKTDCQVFGASADSLDYKGVSVHRLKDGMFLEQPPVNMY